MMAGSSFVGPAQARQDGRLQWGQVIERLFVVVSLLYFLGALGGFFYGAGGAEQDILEAKNASGNFRYQLFGAMIYLIVVAVILQRLDQFAWLCMHNKALVLLVLLAVLSILWSIAPGATLRRSVSLVGTTLFAFYLVMRFRPEELIKLLFVAIGIAAVASLIAGLLFPEVGTHTRPPHTGKWRGIFDFKGNFGRYMALGTIVSTVYIMLARPYQLAYYVGYLVLFLCIGLVIMSDSKAAWLITAFLLLMIPFLRMLQKGRISVLFRLAVILFFVGGGGVLLLLNFYASGLELLGKDATLTGRLGIWAKVFEFGSERPLLGYGYRVFWTDGGADRLFAYLWGRISHSHNSYLDIWLDLGFAGLSLFAVTLVICIHRTFVRLTTSRDAVSLWFPLYLALMTVAALTMETIFVHGRIDWMLYVTTLAYLSTPALRVQAGVSRPARI